MAGSNDSKTEVRDVAFARPGVLFADIAGSTSLYEVLGDAAAKRFVDECLGVMREAVRRRAGRVVKTIGDELMCLFDDADRATVAATDMQLAVSALPPRSGIAPAIRVGFQAGPVIEADGDVFGDTVNTAARMAALAKSGQILTTATTVVRMSSPLRDSTRHIAALSIRGKGEEVDVYEVLWQPNEDLTMAATSYAAGQTSERLELRHGGREIALGGAGARLAIGREATNEIVLAGRKASRVHARIECRRDKFFLTDQSTNGTYVVFAGEAEMVLRREEVMLRGQGQITFGHSLAESAEDIVVFSVR